MLAEYWHWYRESCDWSRGIGASPGSGKQPGSGKPPGSSEWLWWTTSTGPHRVQAEAMARVDESTTHGTDRSDGQQVDRSYIIIHIQ